MPGGAAPPAVSVVVVSRHRPAELALCLGALALQDHPRLELVLVADPAALGTRADLPAKRLAFDEANISAARNRGIAAAAGEVVAFVDDDAVAEPTWAGRLAAAFADPEVIAAAGFTRGPFGRSWQARAEAVTPAGVRPLPVPPGDAATLWRPAEGTVLSTLGTNCAFRRAALLAVGGFDPAFAYHLDESDLNLRLAARFPGAATALVPLAEVTHGTAPSARRDAARVPRNLRQIGRSEAVFAARHAPAGADAAALAALVARERRRLLRHMLAGRLDPLAVAPLLAGLEAGFAAAAGPPPPPPAPLAAAEPPPFLPLPTRPRPAAVLAGAPRAARRLRAEAAVRAARGEIVTLLLLGPGPLPHRTRFTPGGWWEQAGGRLGPSQPGDPALVRPVPGGRAARECNVFERVRNPDRHSAVACLTEETRA